MVLCFLMFNIQSAFATHSAGADIKYKYLSGNQYEVTVTFYRDCGGVAEPNSVSVNCKSQNGNFNFNVTANKVSGVNWERKRAIEVYGKLGQAQRMKLDFFHKSGILKGLPTKIHINMIMWSYSPYPSKLKKLLPLLNSLKLK
jgi:hypothetical protein